MKTNFTLLFFLTFMATSSLVAQERYLDEIFTDVTVTSDVTYGVNATMLYFPVFFEAIPQALTMDVYEPTGDTETDRPLVLVFHTGNFLPSESNLQISGQKTDNGTVEICKQLARRGYVAASVDYRLGWNPTAETQPERALGLIQAAYRGLQDGRTAVRYFRKDAADNGNQYNIDPNKITAWGNGTGGYLVLAMSTLDKYIEIPQTTNGPAKFVLDLNMDGMPETPMIILVYHGDINGLDLAIAPDGNFGPPAGDTTNYPNHVLYATGDTIDSEISMVVNVGGALGDLGWVDENTPPILTVQSVADRFAPYGDEVLIVPTTGDGVVRVQGGSIVHPRLEELGTNSLLNDYFFDDAITAEAQANSATAGHAFFPGLYPYIKPLNSFGFDEGVVIDWWDPTALSPVTGTPWNELPHPLHPAGGSYHEQGLFLNEGMSEEKALGNIQNVMTFTTPRMCVLLDLPCADLFTGVEDIDLDASVMNVYPNPATTEIVVDGKGKTIEKIAIIGMDGKTYGQNIINTTSATIYRNNLPKGVYFIKTFFKEGVATQKVIFE